MKTMADRRKHGSLECAWAFDFVERICLPNPPWRFVRDQGHTGKLMGEYANGILRIVPLVHNEDGEPSNEHEDEFIAKINDSFQNFPSLAEVRDLWKNIGATADER